MSIDNVQDITPRIQYVAAPAQTDFDYPFPVFEDSNLVVYVDGTLIALDTDYTVTGAGNDTGGTVALVSALTGGEVVTIYRDIPIERTTDFQQNGQWKSASTNDELDRLTLVDQQLESRIARAIRVAITSTVADSQLELDSSFAGHFLAFDANLVPTPALFSDTTITPAIAGAFVAPVLDAETATGLTPDTSHLYGDARRYGILPNSSGVASANTAALVALLNPAVSGPKGKLAFPNTTGADVYYFNGMVDVAIGVELDLCGSTLHFSKTYTGADDDRAFLNIVRGVSIYNGTIVIDYNGTGGTGSPGSAIRFGSRSGYAWGSYTGGIEDEDLTYPQGQITLRNLYITSNNPAASSKLLIGLGGLDGVTIDNVQLDGQSVVSYGLYYEFGFWHYEATAANIKSSHAKNFKIGNIRVTNLLTSAGTGVEIVGAGGVSMDGVFVYNAKNGVIVRSGEALFYNKGTPDVNLRPFANLKNIHCKAITSVGINLQGAELASGGYLAAVISGLGHPADYVAQTDLISFHLDGFSVDAGGAGLELLGGKTEVSNGSLHGAASSGQVIISDECVLFKFENVRIVGSSNVGVRASFGSATWSPARLKMGVFDTCLVAGNTNQGMDFGNTQSIKVNNCRLGYSSLYDAAAESTQTFGINVTSTGQGVVADGCFVTTSGGSAAYRNQATATNGCSVNNPRGTQTFSGFWGTNGTDVASATNIADKTSYINTQNKYVGKLCYDTSNGRLMIAQGATDVSTWKVCDNSATVTPS